ncbi:MAG: PQQ-binding-like beta-propeller repeat protein [Planctomycetes bacterium]|nr:PQQ-binding-like beta-propeller repeat protein [Planctomycetota bacterium]
MTDQELLQLVLEKPAAELSPEELAQLLDRVRQSPHFRCELAAHLELENLLAAALGEVHVSVDRILESPAASHSQARRSSPWPKRLGVAAAVLIVGVAVWLWLSGANEPAEPPSLPDRLASSRQKRPPGGKNAAQGVRKPGAARIADAGDPSTAAQKPDESGTPLQPAAEPPPAKPHAGEPWAAAFDPALAIRPVDEAAFMLPASLSPPSPRGGRGGGGGLPKTGLARWLEPVPGQPQRMEDKRAGDAVFTEIDGIHRLKPPLKEGGVLRLGLFQVKSFRMHFWNGQSGVTLAFYERSRPQMWGAFRAERDAGQPLPKKTTLATTDSARHERTGLGLFELRWQKGLLVMSRGAVRLLAVPLSSPPDEILFEGRAWVTAIDMYRGEAFPPEPADGRRVLLAGDRACDLPWYAVLPSGAERLMQRVSGLPRDAASWTMPLAKSVALSGAADGPVGLTSMLAEGEPAEAFTFLPAGLGEIHLCVEDVAPGTGVFLGDEYGKPLHRIAFYRDRRSGQTVFGDARPEERRHEVDVDPAAAPPPYAGSRQWLRLVVGFSTVKLWTSADGMHWGRAFPAPIRPGIEGCRTIGLYALAGPEERRIKLVHLEFREFSAVKGLVAAGQEAGHPTLEGAPPADYSLWLSHTMSSCPPDVDLDAWWRAAAVHTLHAGATAALKEDLLGRLLDEALAGFNREADAAADVRLLNEAALLLDLWEPPKAAAFAERFEALALHWKHEGRPAPFAVAGEVLATAPVWSQGPLPVARPEFVRGGVFEAVYRGQWDEATALARRFRFYLWPDHPRPNWQAPEKQMLALLDWAEATAAQHRPAAIADEHRPVLDRRQQHPLISQLSKEGYNVMAEFEAALRGEAWEDACRIIASAATAGSVPPLTANSPPLTKGGPGGVGLLPDSRDPSLLVSLPRAVALAMRDHPPLREAMQATFGDLGLVRVREAIAAADAATLQAATVQYFGTAAAAEAHRWLGDRALAAGRFGEAVEHYGDALRSADGTLTNDLEARGRLAAALMGRDAGEPVKTPVELGEQVLSPAEFEQLVSSLHSSRAGVTPALSEADASAVPPPAAYVAHVRSRFDGDVGKNPGRHGNHEIDWAAQQLGLAMDGDRFYVSNRFQVACYDVASGQPRWRTGLGGEAGEAHFWPLVSMRPLPLGNKLIVRRFTEKTIELAALDRENGNVLWRHQPDPFVACDPQFVRNQLVAIVAQAVENGVLELSYAAFHPETGTPLSRHLLVRLVDNPQYRPAIRATSADGRIVAAGAGVVFCFDAFGRMEWLHRSPWLPREFDEQHDRLHAVDPPAIDAGRVYVAQPGTRAVTCLELETGRVLWSWPTADVRRLVGVAGERVVFATDRSLEAVAATDGSFAWSRPLPERLHAQLAGEERLVVTRQWTFGDKAHAALMWLDPADGRELSTELVGEPAEKTILLGPLFAAGAKLWAFRGTDWKDPTRQLLELIPDAARSAPGPVSPADPAAWLPSVDDKTRVHAAALLPGWTPLSDQQFADGFRGAERLPEFRGRAHVLRTKAAPERPMRLYREFAIPAEGDARLELDVGHDAGAAWQLVVEADGKPLHTETIDDSTAPNGWKTVVVDLKPHAGQRIRLTISQVAPDDKLRGDAYWARAELKPPPAP